MLYRNQKVFTTSGTFTLPATAQQAVEVLLVGGGGGSAGWTGGSGGCVKKRIVTVTSPVTVTIGAGGTFGNAGGASSFGALLTCAGGMTNGTSAGEGSGPGGIYVESSSIPGGDGQAGAYGFGSGGAGRNSDLFSPVQGVHGGPNGNNTGAGGSAPSGGGWSGICIVTYWDTVP